ncbi:MAG: hypothetical protein QM811_23385 [Pirellulales bacterium]
MTAHAALCPCCAELLSGGELLHTAFAAPPRPSVDFADRVLSAVLADRAASQRGKPLPTAEFVEPAFSACARPCLSSSPDLRVLPHDDCWLGRAVLSPPASLWRCC